MLAECIYNKLPEEEKRYPFGAFVYITIMVDKSLTSSYNNEYTFILLNNQSFSNAVSLFHLDIGTSREGR
jgi:hypothetical protein